MFCRCSLYIEFILSTLRLCLLQLIGGLADEKVRWRETVQQLDYMVNNVAGDVLLAAGYIAYLGPFTVSVWEGKCMLGRMMFECLSLIMSVFDYRTCPGQISPQKSNKINWKFYFLFDILYS